MSADTECHQLLRELHRVEHRHMSMPYTACEQCRIWLYEQWQKAASDNAALRGRADAAEARAYLLLDALDDYSRVSAIDLGEVLRGVFRGETIEPRATEPEARALRAALLAVARPGRAAGEEG